jgi:RNA polymerase sigma-70 factor (ECF subfamily)
METAAVASDPIRRRRFEALAAEVYEPLQRYLRRRADPTSAEDAFAETLLVLWRRLEDVPPEAALPWSYGVARRVLANARRAGDRHVRLVDRVSRERAASAEPETTAGMLDQALAALADADRELLRLWAWEQLAPRDIAVVLGISANAASIRLHRAKGRLAQILAGRKDHDPAGHQEANRHDHDGNGKEPR